MSEGTRVSTKDVDPFHAHLDVCQQCREHPFDLCTVGDLLLKQVAAGYRPGGLMQQMTDHNERLKRIFRGGQG